MRTLIIAAIATILLAAALAPAAAVSAHDAPQSSLSKDAAEAPAQQQRGEAELPWLFAVYAITWAAFFGYIFIMSRRQREMQREIDALNRALQAKDADMG